MKFLTIKLEEELQNVYFFLQPPKIDSLEVWLSHLGLVKYSKLLTMKGISELYQVFSVTDDVS